MTTIQRQIRDAAVALIQSQLPTVQVMRSPRRDLGEADFPAVCIFSHQDRPLSEEDDHMQAHERVYTLRIEVIASARPEEDATDDLCVAVRKALLADDALGLTGVVRRTTWSLQTWAGSDADPAEALSGLEFNTYYLWRPE